MSKKLIIRYLHTFTPKEWDRWELWMKNNISEKQKAFQFLLQLCALKEKLRNNEKSFIEIGKEVFGEDNKNQYHLKLLLKSTEEFLQNYSLETDHRLTQQLLLLQFYAKKPALTGLLLSGIQKLESQLQQSKSSLINKSEYLVLHQLFYQAYFLESANKDATQAIELLQKAIHYQNAHDCLSQLQFWLECNAWKRIFQQKQYEIPAFDLTQLLEKAAHFRKNPLIDLYVQLVIIYSQDQGLASFEGIARKVLDKARDLSEADKNYLATSLTNYASAKINQGNSAYRLPCLNFYLDGLKQGIFLEDKIMNDYIFLDIVDLAASTNQFAIASQFIKSYQENLVLEKRALITLIAEATLLFHQGKHLACLKMFSDHPQLPSSPSLRYRIRLLILRCIFLDALSLNDLDVFEKKYHSFRKYLEHNHQLDYSEERKEQFQQTNLILLHILKLKIIPGRLKKDSKSKLYQELSNNQMYCKLWIEEQVHSLFPP